MTGFRGDKAGDMYNSGAFRTISVESYVGWDFFMSPEAREEKVLDQKKDNKPWTDEEMPMSRNTIVRALTFLRQQADKRVFPDETEELLDGKTFTAFVWPEKTAKAAARAGGNARGVGDEAESDEGSVNEDGNEEKGNESVPVADETECSGGGTSGAESNDIAAKTASEVKGARRRSDRVQTERLDQDARAAAKRALN
jgi:hypothetical protein